MWGGRRLPPGRAPQGGSLPRLSRALGARRGADARTRRTTTVGGRDLGHQPAVERRRVIAPSAAAFGERVLARYRHACTPWIRPVDAVLRVLHAPVQIEHRVFVDARSWRMVTAAANGGVAPARRVGRMAESVVMRAVEWRQRDDDPAAGRPPRIALLRPVAERLRERGDMGAPQVRGVPMVLARQEAPAQSRTVREPVRAGDGWASGAPALRPGARHAESAAAPPAIDVNHLTERVVAAIDRRMIAARERMGS